ncbi:MAG: RNA pseudouridine synthase [Planctomycetales bacterium]|nr:RNA pseudouridine synthase [Planctomycetales bacterium]
MPINDPFGPIPPTVELAEFQSWIVYEDERTLAVNKPGWFVCHPSKNGSFSSLVGVVREYLRLDRIHLVARLDRETSGLVLFAKDAEAASTYQTAVEQRRVTKEYLAIVEGVLAEETLVDQPLGPCDSGQVRLKSMVRTDGQSAVTWIQPLFANQQFTVCRIVPRTGRRHQIRVHAAWLGHPVVGDKVYGPDETLFVQFIQSGWTQRHQQLLPLKRQALHCWRSDFQFDQPHPPSALCDTFVTPPTEDLLEFCQSNLAFDLEAVESAMIRPHDNHHPRQEF